MSEQEMATETGVEETSTPEQSEVDATQEESQAPEGTLLGEAGEEQADSLTEESTEEVELIFGRYKTMEEAEKGFNEQRKMLSQKGMIAPDKYELGEGIELADPENDPLLKSFEEVARKHNLSNDAYNDLIAMKLGFDSEGMVDPAAEMEKLGPDARELTQGVASYFKKNLSEEAFQTLQNVAVTADVIKALDEVRNLNKSAQVPSDIQTPAVKFTEDDAEQFFEKARKAEAAGESEEGQRLRKKGRDILNQLFKS